MKRLAIFISGRGSNMESIIKETQSGILNGIAEVSLVFSDKQDAPGLKKADKYGIKTFSINPKGKSRIEFDKEVMSILNKNKVDLIVLAGYMRILSGEFVKKFPKKIINIHPADTHLHQGLYGYKWAYENKLPETKITVHYVDEGLDTGEIIAQKSVDLKAAKTLQEVEKRGLKTEHNFYPQILKEIITKKRNN
jgi:phosphoribosylglycinamide formyltransferase-1